MGYGYGYCCPAIIVCDEALPSSRFSIYPETARNSWNIPGCFSGTITISGRGISAKFTFDGSVCTQTGTSLSGVTAASLTIYGQAATLSLTNANGTAQYDVTELTGVSSSVPIGNFVLIASTGTFGSSASQPWPKQLASTGTFGTANAIILSSVGGSALAQISERSRSGKQDLTVVGTVYPVATGKSGIFVGGGFGLWIDWTALTLNFGPTDLSGTIPTASQSTSLGAVSPQMSQLTGQTTNYSCVLTFVPPGAGLYLVDLSGTSGTATYHAATFSASTLVGTFAKTSGAGSWPSTLTTAAGAIPFSAYLTVGTDALILSPAFILGMVCFENVNSKTNWFFNYYPYGYSSFDTFPGVQTTGDPSVNPLWNVPFCFQGTIKVSLGPMSFTGDGSTCTLTGSGGSYSGTLTLYGSAAKLVVTSDDGGTATYHCDVIVAGAGTFTLQDSTIDGLPAVIGATGTPSGYSFDAKQSGPIYVGLMSSNGGKWGSLPRIACEGSACMTCNDGTPQQYTLTASGVSGSPFTIDQATAVSGAGPSLVRGVCLFGIGTESIPPITPVTPNPLVDFSGVDTAIGTKVQLTKWPNGRREPPDLQDYAFIDDFKIYWYLALDFASSLNNIYVIAAVNGKFCQPQIYGAWQTSFSCPAFGSFPAISCTLDVSSSTVVPPPNSFVPGPSCFYGSVTFATTVAGLTCIVQVLNRTGYSPFNFYGAGSLQLLLDVSFSSGGIDEGGYGGYYDFIGQFCPLGGATGDAFTYRTGQGQSPPCPATLGFTAVGGGNASIVNYPIPGGGGIVAPVQPFQLMIGLWAIPTNQWCCYGSNTLPRIYPDEEIPDPWPAVGPLYYLLAGIAVLSQDPAGSNFPSNVTAKALLPTLPAGQTIPCEIECLWLSTDGKTWTNVGTSYITGLPTTPCPAGTSCVPPPFKPSYTGQFAYVFCS